MDQEYLWLIVGNFQLHYIKANTHFAIRLGDYLNSQFFAVVNDVKGF